jgi:hypothetical protein
MRNHTHVPRPMVGRLTTALAGAVMLAASLAVTTP